MERRSRPEGDTSSAQSEKKRKKKELGPDQKPLIEFLDLSGERAAYNSACSKKEEIRTYKEKAALSLYKAIYAKRGAGFNDKSISDRIQQERQTEAYKQAFPENVGSSTSGGRDNTVDFDLNEMP
jgi:hypothetical protein